MLSALAIRNLQQTALVIGGANAVGFTITAAFKTHQITDLVGVGSFVLAALKLTHNHAQGQELVLSRLLTNRVFWLNAGVVVWGSRLASFLFNRILQIKEDHRLRKFFPAHNESWLDSSRSNFPVNLAFFWSIQAVWGWVCMLPVTLTNSLPLLSSPALALASPGGVMGSVMKLPGAALLPWLPVAGMIAGIAIEAAADYQKHVFRQDQRNDKKWCDVGLWKWCRYPNYFGEMLTWWSIYFTSLPALLAISPGAAALGALSPSFVSFLLLKVSGIPLSEKSNNKKYAGNEEYKHFVKNTPLLFPWPPSAQNKDKK